jgi:predicted small lipoprotein YifL
MEKIIKLTALACVIISISACGKMGNLEKVKSSSVAPVVTHIA